MRCALLAGLMVAILAAVGASAPAAAPGSAPALAAAAAPGPVAAVRTYLAAMNRHDPAAICASFAPALRAYERRWDNPDIHPVPCRTAVAAHFRYYSDERWRSARIVRVRSVRIDRRGIAAVTVTLAHHYVCVPPYVSPDSLCKTRTIRRPDVIYLTRLAGAWRVVKPGLLFRAAELSSPYDSEFDWYPPGDPRTVARPVADFGGGLHCPPARATVSGHDPVDIQSGPRPAPWLSISHLSVARLAGGRTCFALALRARPRPDTEYGVYASTVAQSAPFDLYEVDFDGLGRSHVLILGVGSFSDPSLSAKLPRVSLHGTELDILAPRTARLTPARYLVSANASSLQLSEPLLPDPLQAADGGMPYGACLVVPTGRLVRAGNCGAVPSG